MRIALIGAGRIGRLHARILASLPGVDGLIVADAVAAAAQSVADEVGGVFAGSAEALSVAAAFPTLARWDREEGSLSRGAIAERRKSPRDPSVPRGLLSFRDGLQAIPKALAASLGDGRRSGIQGCALAPTEHRHRSHGR